MGGVEWSGVDGVHYTPNPASQSHMTEQGQSVAAAAARGHRHVRHVRVAALFPRRRCWQDAATASAKRLGPSLCLDTNAASAQCSA